MIERRRFPRYECAFNVQYATLGVASIESQTRSVNISRCGIRMPISRMVRDGDLVQLNIEPYTGNTGVSALGKVVWTRKLSDQTPFEMDAGIEFKRVDPTGIEKLIQEVAV